ECASSLGLTGDEVFSLTNVRGALAENGNVRITAVKPNGKQIHFEAKARIDTPQEGEYYRNGGILPFVLRQLIATA
ncbi:MAG: hypothetical protein ACRD3Y_06105, partial [Bryobacteraceae bacterium]